MSLAEIAKCPPRPVSERLFAAAALVIGLALVLPVVTIIVLALMPTENVWPHLLSTVLPGYVMRTVALMAGVGLITFVVGTGTAWLVTMCRFPLRPLFVWASLLPMAMPGYIVAYAYVDFLSFAGPVQTGLRGLMGWKTPADYWFPEIRSLGGAIFVLSMVLYPYVFLTARASFIRQPATQLEVARALGRSPWGAFRTVALPLARPGIAVGVSLALMECLNDIGAAGFFGVRTLTLGVYTTWLSQGNLGGAAQISAVMLLFIFVLLWIERQARRRQSFVLPAQRPRQPDRIRLNGWQRALAVAPLLLMALRKRSFTRAAYSVVSWCFNAAGLVRGLVPLADADSEPETLAVSVDDTEPLTDDVIESVLLVDADIADAGVGHQFDREGRGQRGPQAEHRRARLGGRRFARLHVVRSKTMEFFRRLERGFINLAVAKRGDDGGVGSCEHKGNGSLSCG